MCGPLITGLGLIEFEIASGSRTSHLLRISHVREHVVTKQPGCIRIHRKWIGALGAAIHLRTNPTTMPLATHDVSQFPEKIERSSYGWCTQLYLVSPPARIQKTSVSKIPSSTFTLDATYEDTTGKCSKYFGQIRWYMSTKKMCARFHTHGPPNCLSVTPRHAIPSRRVNTAPRGYTLKSRSSHHVHAHWNPVKLYKYPLPQSARDALKCVQSRRQIAWTPHHIA